MGNYMLAPEQPIENRNYAYDEDIVSDDGRIWFDFYVVYDDYQAPENALQTSHPIIIKLWKLLPSFFCSPWPASRKPEATPAAPSINAVQLVWLSAGRSLFDDVRDRNADFFGDRVRPVQEVHGEEGAAGDFEEPHGGQEEGVCHLAGTWPLPIA